MSRSSSNLPAPTGGDFILYTAPDGAVKVDVFFKDETVWLTQKALAELFGVKRPAITKHLLNIFDTGELAEDSVCSILEHTAGDGKTYSAKYYNLDAIIAVGYRVNCERIAHYGECQHVKELGRKKDVDAGGRGATGQAGVWGGVQFQTTPGVVAIWATAGK